MPFKLIGIFFLKKRKKKKKEGIFEMAQHFKLTEETL